MTIALQFGRRAFPIPPNKFNLGPVSGEPDRCYGGMAFQMKFGEMTLQ
jgi:hypothetical protein